MTTASDAPPPDPNAPGDGGLRAILQAFAGLEVKLGQVADAQTEANRWAREVELARLPIDSPIFANGIASAAGVVLINCGGPAQGRQWEVRRVGICGVTPETAVTGTADLFDFAGNLATGAPGAQGWGGHTPTIPAVLTFSARQFVIHEGSFLWVVAQGVTAAQQVIATGLAVDYPIRPTQSTVSI